MKKKLLAIAALCGVGGMLDAQVLTSISDVAPTQNVVLANDATPSGSVIGTWDGSFNTTTNWRDTGQSFQANSDFEWAALAFLVYDSYNGSSGQSFTIEIYESTVGGSSIGTVISTQSGTLPTFASAATDINDQFLRFDFEEAISVTEGNYYTAMLHFDSAGDATKRIRFRGTAVANTLLGDDARIFRENSPFSADPVLAFTSDSANYALSMYVIAVPEPSTVALMMGGVSLLGASLYRRRSVKK